MLELEVRCPHTLKKLFMKITVADDIRYTEENWIEIACNDCLRNSRALEKANTGTTDILRVLHYYSFIGRFMKTEIVRMGETSVLGP